MMDELKVMQKRAARAGFVCLRSKNDSRGYFVLPQRVRRLVSPKSWPRSMCSSLNWLNKWRYCAGGDSSHRSSSFFLMEKRAAVHDLAIRKGDDGYGLFNAQGEQVGSAEFLFGSTWFSRRF